MRNRDELFKAIDQIGLKKSGALDSSGNVLKSSSCPPLSELRQLNLEKDDSLLEHIAFCRDCQTNLRALNASQMHQKLMSSQSNENVLHAEPDIDRLKRNIMRRARWISLSDQIGGVLEKIHQGFAPGFLTAAPMTSRSMDGNGQSFMELVIF